MKFLTRRNLLIAALIALIFIGGLCFRFLQQQRNKYQQAKATYYALASAMEQENKTQLELLATRDCAADLTALAKHYGGIRRLGKLMRESPKVEVSLHAPLSSFEIAGKIENRYLLILISTHREKGAASTAFFTSG